MDKAFINQIINNGILGTALLIIGFALWIFIFQRLEDKPKSRRASQK